MGLDNNEFWIWWKKYGEHLTAPLILIALIILGVQLHRDNVLKEEISENCGWGEDDYQCYCVRQQYQDLKDKYEGVVDLSNFTIGEKNVTLAG